MDLDDNDMSVQAHQLQQTLLWTVILIIREAMHGWK